MGESSRERKQVMNDTKMIKSMVLQDGREQGIAKVKITSFLSICVVLVAG